MKSSGQARLVHVKALTATSPLREGDPVGTKGEYIQSHQLVLLDKVQRYISVTTVIIIISARPS